jgi:hypothetical protein
MKQPLKKLLYWTAGACITALALFAWRLVDRERSVSRASEASDEIATLLPKIKNLSPSEQWSHLAELGPAELVSYSEEKASPDAASTHGKLKIRFRRDFGNHIYVFVNVTAVVRDQALVIESGWIDQTWS